MAKIIDVKSRKGTCSIHGEELIETHPADAENGPSPDDVLNELVCLTCANEEQYGRAAFVSNASSRTATSPRPISGTIKTPTSGSSC